MDRIRVAYLWTAIAVTTVFLTVSGAQQPAIDPSQPQAAPGVITDKMDYLPGETVRIQGYGFRPADAITVRVTHADGTAEEFNGHEPWTVTTDDEGRFESEWFVNEDAFNSLLYLVAYDAYGVGASMLFTDGVTQRVVNAANSGWYDPNGSHNAANQNYIVGQFSGTYRDYFVFNLSGLSGTVLTASLRATNVCFQGSPRTLTLRNVSTSISTLIATQSGRTDIHADLGNGTVYGSVTLSTPNTNPVVVPMNGAGVSAIQGSLGGVLAFGGDYPGAPGDWILGCTSSPLTVQLVLQIQIPPQATTLTVAPATGVFAGTTALQATLKTGSSGIGGKTIDFKLNGIPVGVATTNAVGDATLAAAPLAGIDAGSYPSGVTARFAGDDDFLTSSANAQLTVNRATPILTWPTPAPITYGTALSSAQLNATASVAGTFEYSPTAGSLLPAGSHTLTVTFTPASTNYEGATSSVLLSVTRAAPDVHVSAPDATYTGLPYGGASCSAAGIDEDAVPAVLSFEDTQLTPLAGPPINAGSYVAKCSVVGNVNYAGAVATTTFTIAAAVPEVTWSAPAPIVYGTRMDAVQQNAIASTPGTFNYDPAAGTLLNAGVHTLTATFTPTDTHNYTGHSAAVTLTVLKARPVLVFEGDGTFTYNGSPRVVVASAAGVDGESLGALTVTYSPGGADPPVNAGSYTAQASYPGNDNYENKGGTASVQITPAAATLTLANLAQVFDGTPRAVAVDTNPLGLSGVEVTYNGAPTPPTEPGSYAVEAILAHENYSAPAAAGTLVIARATPAIAITGGPFVYNGQGYNASVSATGYNGQPLAPVAITFNGASDLPINAGTYAVVASFGGDTHHAPASATGSITIARAQATLGISNLLHTYDGTPKGATVTSNPVDLQGITVTYNQSLAAPTTAGEYAVSAGLSNANYDVAPASATLRIDKATPHVTWNDPPDIVYLTPLSSGQLNAQAAVAGSLTYTPAAGTVLGAGTHVLTATFAPTDAVNYATTSTTVTLTVDKAAPILSTSGGTFTFNGLPHASVGTSNVPGSFSYAYAPGGSAAPVNASDTPYAVTATFTPGDTANYRGATATNSITINRASTSLSWTAPSVIGFGTPLSGMQLNATGSVPGTINYTPAPGTILPAGPHTLQATLTPGDATNYLESSAQVAIAVVHGWSGVLQPINTDGSSIFKLGSTVPVKFRLTGGSAGLVITARIFVAKISNGIVGDEAEAISTAQVDNGNVFRYDPDAGHYIFNLGTKSMPQGSWQLRIDLGDGAINIVVISLRK